MLLKIYFFPEKKKPLFSALLVFNYTYTFYLFYTVPFSVLLCFFLGISQLANFEPPLDRGRFTFVSVLSSQQFQDVLRACGASA